MAHLTNFSFAIFHKFYPEDVSLFLLHYGAKKSKITKNSKNDLHLSLLGHVSLTLLKSQSQLKPNKEQIFNWY